MKVGTNRWVLLRVGIATLLALFTLASKKPRSSQLTPREYLTDEIIKRVLEARSSPGSGQTVDCGVTSLFRSNDNASSCARSAFENGKPFHVLFSGPEGFFHLAFGLAGDGDGNVDEVLYDSRGLANFGMGRNSQALEDNRIRVTKCFEPVRLVKTQEGALACAVPVNEQESQKAAQQKPIDTTICTISERPSAFNNKLVRVHGYVSGNFEYSELESDGCSRSLWFAYPYGASPGLIATVTGRASPGSKDEEDRFIRPIPVKLVKDSNFRKFEKLMKARADADKQSMEKDADNFVLHRVGATFVGRIDGVSDDILAFHLKRKVMDRADFLGFGQMGLFDAQFVMQSVESDSALETSPPADTK